VADLNLADVLSQVQGLLNPPQSQDQGLLSQALGPYGGAMNVGLNLLANGGPSPVPHSFGQIVGQSALQAQQVAQQSQNNALQRQLMAMQIAQGGLGLQQSINRMNALQDAYGPQGMAQSGGAQTGAQPPSAAQPQPAQQPVAIPQAPQGMPDPTTLPVNGMTPDQFRRLQIFGFNKDPGETEKTLHELQQQSAARIVGPQVAAMDAAIDSDNPVAFISKNPGLIAAYQQAAPSAGINIGDKSTFTNDNVRKVLSAVRGQTAAYYGLPAGKEPELQQVVGPNGTPQLVTKTQAIGKQPFNSSIFGANNLSSDAIQLAADTYRTTGKMPAAFGRNPAMQAKVLDRVAADAAANGDTAGSIAARSSALKANGMALDQVTKLESATTSFAGTLDKNLDNLLAAAKKVDSTGSPLINRALRAWQQGVTGDKDTAQMVTWLNAVEGEYAKINSGSLGNAPTSDAAKRDAKDVINKAMSAGGMEAVAQAMRQETQNRLGAIREQKQSLMGSLSTGAPGTPQAASAPKPTTPPPMTNAKGWTLHVDKNGTRAYVSPDGKQYELVK